LSLLFYYYVRNSYFNAQVDVTDCTEDYFNGLYDIEMSFLSRFKNSSRISLESEKWIIELSDLYAFDEHKYSIQLDRDPGIILDNINNAEYRYLRRSEDRGK